MRYYCCGMIRSGSTWQYNIVRELLESRNLAKPEGFINKGDKIENFISKEDNFIVKLHSAIPLVVKDIKSGAGKGIYIYRELEDVAVSVMNMKQKSLEWVIKNEDLKKAWDNYKIWTSTHGVLIQEYAEVMNKPMKAIREISAFLGLQLSEEELSAVQKKYSIESQKKFISEMQGSSGSDKTLRKVRRRVGGIMHKLIGKKQTKKIVKLFGGIGAEKIDKSRLLHSEHINIGEVGYWKKVLKPNDQKRLTEYIKELKSN